MQHYCLKLFAIISLKVCFNNLNFERAKDSAEAPPWVKNPAEDLNTVYSPISNLQNYVSEIFGR